MEGLESEVNRATQTYPAADMTPREFEEFVAETLESAASGAQNLRVEVHSSVVGADGTYEFDATMRHEVGYLARHMSVAYGPVFATIAPRAIACPASVKGGWDRGPGNRGSIGVVLRLGSPGELAAELWLDDHPIRAQHPWAGKTVVFTGDSLFAIGLVSLDRMGRRYLAERAGCRTWPRVTKQVDVCVASHPDEETGNLRKAEQYGLELMPESDFWSVLGLALDRR